MKVIRLIKAKVAIYSISLQPILTEMVSYPFFDETNLAVKNGPEVNVLSEKPIQRDNRGFLLKSSIVFVNIAQG